MNRTKNQGVVWITGASSGIGLALTKQFLDAGWKVLASARGQGGLTPLLSQHEQLHFIPLILPMQAKSARCKRR